MLSALNYLHGAGIVHRDLKLENFIFTSEDDAVAEIKLIDFGYSRNYLFGEEQMHDQVGTCYYVAPEVLKKNYNEVSDLWSLGVVAYIMLTSMTPFGGNDSRDIMLNIVQECKDPDALEQRFKTEMEDCGLTSQCISFMLGLLTVNPAKRSSAATALKAEWFSMDTVPGGDGPAQMRASVNTKNRMAGNLKAFRDLDKLQRSAMMAVTFGLTSEQLQKLNQAFADADTNKDGVISMGEFKAMMQKEHMYDTDEVKSMFDAVDMDSEGTLQYSEFISAALTEQKLNHDDEVEAAFHRLDLDESGQIDKADLKRMLVGMDEAAIDRLIDEAEAKSAIKDGKIDLEEFKRAIALRNK